MYFTVHATVGAIIGQQTGDPFLAIIAGFVSHLVLDSIPHGDTQNAGIRYTKKNLSIIGGIDGIAFLIIFFWIGTSQSLSFFSLPVITGIVGATLPDILQIFHYLFGRKYFVKAQEFHNIFHDAISKRWDIPLPLGAALQSLLLIGLLTIVI